jgi:hypothetical protein
LLTPWRRSKQGSNLKGIKWWSKFPKKLVIHPSAIPPVAKLQLPYSSSAPNSNQAEADKIEFLVLSQGVQLQHTPSFLSFSQQSKKGPSLILANLCQSPINALVVYSFKNPIIIPVYSINLKEKS